MTTAGFLNLNKPSGWTSHDCVGRLRRLLRTKKVGHGGTLDPAATGVLPIAVGRATQLLRFLATDKAYHAVIRFGLTTTTDDLQGTLVEQCSATDVTLEQVTSILPRFLGSIAQVPPRYSAIQVHGQRLYELARQGKPVEIPTRQVTVHSIEVLDWQPGEAPELTLAIACGPGTYIRALARDLGQVLGSGATLSALTRTRSNGFHLDDSLTLDQVERQLAENRLSLIAPAAMLTHLPAITLTGDAARRFCHGQKLSLEQAPVAAGRPLRVLNQTNELLGIAQIRSQTSGYQLKPERVMVAPPQGASVHQP
ncbi:tRNA pseudouridine synthase B [Halomicronema hongdechloris C2206]|uniref:tRNA pseudouridine synthase B n=1 Tax=Halomicronema hongdechloris C2206 TaxID=1641165 RepID=A0A1Z3HRD3_9CYAN|nr:tRNA pseudouridine(55) synthase TruB [Halomicronema hongdechloris]ASC72871.1 tRNA pseudouridine synthase B [Halomicronema hongdechloris C2206]